MRYALLITQEGTELASDEQSARTDAFFAFQEEMTERGVLLGGERLRPVASATTVRVRNGDLVVADGPFAETKEQIAGFYLVDCKDIDEAIEVASKIPSAGWGSVEVRPIWEM
jgi:hypothetical protein